MYEQGEYMDDIPEEIKNTFMKDEEVLYVRFPKGAIGGYIFTNKRIIKFTLNKSKFITKLANYNWQDVKSVSINEGLLTSSIHLDMKEFDDINTMPLPKGEAKKMFAVIREMQDAVQKAPSDVQTPTQKLKYLKEMLDEGLLTQAEYDTKKADLLSRM